MKRRQQINCAGSVDVLVRTYAIYVFYHHVNQFNDTCQYFNTNHAYTEHKTNHSMCSQAFAFSLYF